MFNLFSRSAPRHPSIQEALANAGVRFTSDPAKVAVLKRQGSYAGRQVSYFRAYDPTRAVASHIQVRAYADLDGHHDLIVGSGHVEQHGLVMVNQRPVPEGSIPHRAPADRTVHADDERFVDRRAELARLAATSPIL
jgi:hypothetical protein